MDKNTFYNCYCTYLESVVGPAAKLHDARLLVKGEVLDIHLARRVVDCGRLPLDLARRHEGRLRRQRDLKVAIGARRKKGQTVI